MVKRIVAGRCFGLIIDVQRFFLSQLGTRRRAEVTTDTKNLVRLLGLFGIPLVVTLERPVGQKGSLPAEVKKHLGDGTEIFEKDFFDLCKEPKIRNYLRRLKRRQAIMAGCETDVCVLQSCLGLLEHGYEVFVVADLLFSSARDVDSALARMKSEGATFLTYKTLYYELMESVAGPGTALAVPEDLPDSAMRAPERVKKT